MLTTEEESPPYFSKLALQNVGKFEQLDLTLGPFTLLVGPNDSGKTTILDALHVVSGREKLSIEQVRRSPDDVTGRARRASISGRLQHPSAAFRDRCNLYDEDPGGLRIDWQIEGTREEDVSLGSPEYFLEERVPEDPRLHNWDYSADEEKEILSDYDIEWESTAEKRKEQYEELKANILTTPAETVLAWVPATKNDFLRLAPATEQINAGHVENPLKLLADLLDQEARGFVYPADEEGRKSRIRPLEDLETSASETLNERLKTLAKRMERHLPGLTDVRVEPVWDFVNGADFTNIFLLRDGEPIPMHELGGGSHARSALAMLEWSAEDHEGKQRIIRTMDEPDHRLHFDAQRRMIQILRSDTGDPDSYLGQCIVSTHSLIMVDATPLHEVVYLPLDIDKEVSLAPLLTKDEAEAGELLGNIAAGLGLNTSWVYLEKAMIVVEGATEHNYIRELYHQVTGHTLVEDGVQVWDSQGCGHIVRTLERLKDAGRAETFVVLDSDAKQKKFGGQTIEDALEALYKTTGDDRELVWLGDKELEDEWTHGDLAGLAEKHWPRADEQPWEALHFSDVPAAEKPSQKIVEILKQGCAQNLQNHVEPTKEIVGLRMGQLEAATHPPRLVQLLMTVHAACNED